MPAKAAVQVQKRDGGGANEATSKHSKVPHEMKGHAATGLLRAKSRKGRPDGHRDGRRENERSA